MEVSLAQQRELEEDKVQNESTGFKARFFLMTRRLFVLLATRCDRAVVSTLEEIVLCVLVWVVCLSNYVKG